LSPGNFHRRSVQLFILIFHENLSSLSTICSSCLSLLLSKFTFLHSKTGSLVLQKPLLSSSLPLSPTLPMDPTGSSSQTVSIEQLAQVHVACVTPGLGVTPRSPGGSANGTSGPTAPLPLFFPSLPDSVSSPVTIKSPQGQVTPVSAVSSLFVVNFPSCIFLFRNTRGVRPAFSPIPPLP
jgi:hypothetical protein